MKNIVLWIKSYWLFIVLCAIIILLLLILIFAGEQIEKGTWPREVISALLGTATVAGITYLLLKGQANNENAVEQNKKVFENRLNAYDSFLETLKKVVINNIVDEKSEKLLQFGIATIGMHTDSKDMLTISKDLKYILQKIKIKERADGSIWNELMEIVNVFHHSLYKDDNRNIDSNMHKALRNFSGLCVDENYEILQFVECLLSSYRFDSFIVGKCLFFSIPTKKLYIKKYNIPKRIYLTLRIDENIKQKYYSGIVAVYGEKNKFDQVRNIINHPDLWLGPNHLFKEETDIELGVNIARNAYVFYFNKMEEMALQSAVCDIFNFMHPVWAGKDIAYLRKNKDGKLLREIPFEKLPKNTVTENE